MRITQTIILLLLCAGVVSTAQGQSARAYLKKGLEAYQEKNYSSALAYFQVVIEETGERLDALFYAGESARQIRSYLLAEQYLEAIPKEDRREDFALTNFYLGMVKKNLEKFDEAIVLFRDFATERNEFSEFRAKALNEIRNCEWAKTMMEKPAKAEVTQLPQGVNSIYSDYAPMAVGDTLYYTSTDEVKINLRKKKKKTRLRKKLPKVKQELVTKIFFSVNGLSGEPVRQNARGEDSFTANPAFDEDGSRMYYTICEQLDEEKSLFRCELYYRDRQPGGGFGRAIRLPDYINQPGSNSTQPTIGTDKKTGQKSLYFVSDRPGGEGKLDIWVSVMGRNGEFHPPVNLESINTPEDDLTPFFDPATQTLFFASDGYQNFGGYDIFKSVKEEKGWTEPENLGYPINSSFDDLYYSVDNKTGKAYLSSNRKGAFCISPDKDCNLHDLYELTSHTEMQVAAFSEKDFSSISGAVIELEDLATGKRERFEMEGEEYKFSLALHPQHSYRLTMSKEGFDPGTVTIAPSDFVSEELPKKYVFLQPWSELLIRTLDAQTGNPLLGLSIRVTDLKEKKSKTYHLAFDKFECKIPVKTDREYEVVAIKSGFDAVKETVSFTGLTNQPAYVKDLYLKPFFGGLPLTLYFDNDMPNENAEALTYDDAYQKYMAKKGDFIEKFAGGMRGTDGEIARYEAARFFDNEIQSGYYNLLKLSENLLFALQNGEKIELHIDGYASPLADDNYNRQLAERRIQTVVSHFENYRDGALTKYLGKELVIETAPYGERQAVSGAISDSPADRRSSVYSPKASLERRVVIGGFRITGNSVSTTLK